MAEENPPPRNNDRKVSPDFLLDDDSVGILASFLALFLCFLSSKRRSVRDSARLPSLVREENVAVLLKKKSRSVGIRIRDSIVHFVSEVEINRKLDRVQQGNTLVL